MAWGARSLAWASVQPALRLREGRREEAGAEEQAAVNSSLGFAV